jgi:hypothetical protein
MNKYKQIQIFTGDNTFYVTKATNEWLKKNDNRIEINDIKFDIKKDTFMSSTCVVILEYFEFNETD